MELKAGAVNQIAKDTVFFLENEAVLYVCAVVRGKVTAKSDTVKTSFGPGNFIGIADLFVGHYLSDYIAEENTVLFAFPAQSIEDLRRLLETNNKDYRGLMVSSLTKQFFELSKINKEYYTVAKKLYTLLKEGYGKYKNSCKAGGTGITVLSGIEEMEEYSAEASSEENSPKNEKNAYYSDLAKVPADVQKSFFACGMELTMVHISELSSCIVQLLLDTREVCEYLNRCFPCFYNDSEQNLLMLVIRLAYSLERSGRPNQELQKLVDFLLNEFNQIEATLASYMGTPPLCNRERLEKFYLALLSHSEIEEEGEQEHAPSEDELYRKLKGTLKQLIEFSGLPADGLKAFIDAMEQFVAAKDRMSTDDSFRGLRRQIADGFYKLYHAVFLKQLNKEMELPKAVELFLNFGFTDERLLTKEQALQLCRLRVETSAEYHCTVFTIPQWLTAVYNGERQPSKNEFDMEYNEMLRELKKTGEITAEEEQKRLNDQMEKLNYEVQNMFRYNHRIVNGQPSVFVPVLCSEQIINAPERAAVTKDRIGQTVEKFRDIDYSVFCRELMYADPEAKIEKEFEMKEVVPDIVLFPAYGQNAVMWQEISCKKRDSAGRFLFPVFVEGSLDDLMIRCFGRFRWELCRTMMGTSWNNIQYKSLTSEYSDYIQFYRKNKDLSEERKEKIKLQIAKGKGNTREIFLLDYELWIKAEAMGAIRLNKIAREILTMYCPFNKEIRNALESQPTYAEAIAKFKRENLKKARELELRYHALTKQGIALTQPLLDTLSFYKDK